MKHRGLVIDECKVMDTRKTKWYDTYKEAHDAAEKLCKRTMGNRGRIDVETLISFKDLTVGDAYVEGGGFRTNAGDYNGNWYQANATDKDGNEFTIIWTRVNWKKDSDAACNWDKPQYIFNDYGYEMLFV